MANLLDLLYGGATNPLFGSAASSAPAAPAVYPPLAAGNTPAPDPTQGTAPAPAPAFATAAPIPAVYSQPGTNPAAAPQNPPVNGVMQPSPIPSVQPSSDATPPTFNPAAASMSTPVSDWLKSSPNTQTPTQWHAPIAGFPSGPFDRPNDSTTGMPYTKDAWQAHLESDPNASDNTWSNRHPDLRRGLFSLFAGLREYAGDMQRHPGMGWEMLEPVMQQDQAQRNWLANRPALQQAADTKGIEDQERIDLGNAQMNNINSETQDRTWRQKQNVLGQQGQLQQQLIAELQAGETPHDQLGPKYASLAASMGVPMPKELIDSTIQQFSRKGPTFKVDHAADGLPTTVTVYKPEGGVAVYPAGDPNLPADAKAAVDQYNANYEKALDDKRQSTKISIDLHNQGTNWGGTPGAPGVGGGAGAGGVNQTYIDSLPAAMKGTVVAIGEGRMELTPGMMRSKGGQQLVTAVTTAYPGFDSSRASSYTATRKDFTSGTTSKGINTINTALNHLGNMFDHVSALGTIPGIKTVAQMVGNKDATALNATIQQVSDEVGAAYRAGALTEGEQKQIVSLLSVSSPAELRANIQQVATLLGGKLDGYQNQWQNGMPSGVVSPVQIFSPTARVVYNRLTGQDVQPNTAASGTPLPGSPVAPPAPAPAANGLTNLQINPTTNQQIGWDGKQWVDTATMKPYAAK